MSLPPISYLSMATTRSEIPFIVGNWLSNLNFVVNKKKKKRKKARKRCKWKRGR